MPAPYSGNTSTGQPEKTTTQLSVLASRFSRQPIRETSRKERGTLQLLSFLDPLDKDESLPILVPEEAILVRQKYMRRPGVCDCWLSGAENLCLVDKEACQDQRSCWESARR
jgi:hypothetical protein